MKSHDGLLRYRLLRLHLIQLMRCDVFLRHARNVSNDDKWPNVSQLRVALRFLLIRLNLSLIRLPFSFLSMRILSQRHFISQTVCLYLTNIHQFRLYTASFVLFSSQPPYCECECKEERVSILFPFFFMLK